MAHTVQKTPFLCESEQAHTHVKQSNEQNDVQDDSFDVYVLCDLSGEHLGVEEPDDAVDENGEPVTCSSQGEDIEGNTKEYEHDVSDLSALCVEDTSGVCCSLSADHLVSEVGGF